MNTTCVGPPPWVFLRAQSDVQPRGSTVLHTVLFPPCLVGRNIMASLFYHLKTALFLTFLPHSQLVNCFLIYKNYRKLLFNLRLTSSYEKNNPLEPPHPGPLQGG